MKALAGIVCVAFKGYNKVASIEKINRAVAVGHDQPCRGGAQAESVLQASGIAQVSALSEPHSIFLGGQQMPKQVDCCHLAKNLCDDLALCKSLSILINMRSPVYLNQLDIFVPGRNFLLCSCCQCNHLSYLL